MIDCMRIGGAQRRLFQLLKGLQQTNEIKNTLVLFSDEIDFEGLQNINVRIFVIRTEKYISYKAFVEFKKIIAQVRPDIVHSWQLIASFYATLLSLPFRFRHLNAMINDSTPRKFFNKEWLLAKAILPFAHTIISNSNAGLDVYKVKRRKNVFVIYNGFDFERVTKAKSVGNSETFHDKTEDCIIIGMVARFENAKDYPTIIQAVCTLLDQNVKVRFVAVGNGNTLEQCKKLVPEKYNDAFFFLGKRGDIDDLVPLFDICVLSTFSEGISNSIMEYMAFKKPVLATDCLGNKEIVIEEQTGLLVAVKDKDDWVEKLLRLIEQSELRHFYGTNGYQRLNDHFHLDKMIMQYKKLYNQLL